MVAGGDSWREIADLDADLSGHEAGVGGLTGNTREWRRAELSMQGHGFEIH